MSDLSALIVALEGATGPSRELADEVLLACGWTRLAIGCHSSRGLIYNWFNPAREHVIERPDPLSSIDAALTLVPEGHLWSVGTWSDNFATVSKKPCSGNTVLAADWTVEGVASGPVIALCIAALKARQASSTPSDQSPVPQNTGHDR